MTYMLEKTFELDDNFKLKPARFAILCIRPCKWDYQTCVKFYTGQLHKTMRLEGCIEWFNHRSFMTIEEWMINLELDKGIVIDFENTILLHKTSSVIYDTYTIKTIDLHTKKTIDDRTTETIEMLKKKSAIP